MNSRKRFKRFSRVLIGLFLGFTLLCLIPAAAFPQSPNYLSLTCRQINRDAASGLIAYYAPGRSPITITDGKTDGPAADTAVYLTSSPAEISADGNYVRIWFNSIDPNYKLGWVARRFNNNVNDTRDDTLKSGSQRWRALNCS